MFVSPLQGKILPLLQVNDDVFSQELLGPGFALLPTIGVQTIYSPIAGTLVRVMPHAFAVSGELDVLVHLGLNTVKQQQHFTAIATQGDIVEGGAPVCTWNITQAQTARIDPICPVVFMSGRTTVLDAILAKLDTTVSAKQVLAP
ncbi:MAG: PTS glucose transporter subunit IIA [Actinomycetaceae bacterium]|nr:PTS glucose transporter subunit IIA [Actinomycetaceae bacterium]